MKRIPALRLSVTVLCVAGAFAMFSPTSATALTAVKSPVVEQAGADECANDWAGSIQDMTITRAQVNGDKLELTVRPEHSTESTPVLMAGGDHAAVVQAVGEHRKFTVTFLDSGCVDAVQKR